MQTGSKTGRVGSELEKSLLRDFVGRVIVRLLEKVVDLIRALLNSGSLEENKKPKIYQ